MGINSVLTINGTSYNASQRANASILPTSLERTLEGGYDSFNFFEIPRYPQPSFSQGTPVSLTIDIGDGNGAVTRFSGVIVDVQSEHNSQYGWGHAYTASGLKFLCDRIPITAVDGTGQAVYNRVPLDEYYNASDAGLSLGTIFERILTIPATAQALNAVGVGGYTGLPSAPVLPASTLADFALLAIVPPRPVILQGEGVFNYLDQEIQQWCPKYYFEIQPDGIIRVKDTTSSTFFPAQTITCPSANGTADPVAPPRVQRSTKNCATRLRLRGGPQVEVAILSLVDGTLAEVFTSTDKSNWNLTFFTAPKGATDYGTVSAVTSTSATLTSHDASATWSTNFWSTNNATITLIDSLATGINQFESRLVTSNNALSAGGSSTVNWDSTWPITATSYDMYRITGGAGGLNDCWRTYTPREPATGNTGLSTYVGSHLVTRSAHAVKVANADQTFHAYYTTAIVKGGSLGQEMPLGIQAVPSEGIFRFTQPTVTVFGQTSTLNAGSPTNAAQGLPLDVIVYALYSRGALSVVVPPDVAGVPQYEGTAYTEDGVEVTKTLDFPGWLWQNDTTSFEQLAQEILDTLSAAEIELSIPWHITPGGPVPAWDFLSFGYSLNIDIQGQTSPWSNLNAPIRQISLKWDWTGQGSQMLGFGASTRRRGFSGFDLYVHPEFAQGSPLGGAFQDATGNFEAFNRMLGEYGTPALQTPQDVIIASGMPASPFSLQDAADIAQPTRMPSASPRSQAPKPEPTFEPLDRNKKARDQMLNDLVKPLITDTNAAADRMAMDNRNANRFADKIVNSAVNAGLQPLRNAEKEVRKDQVYADQGQDLDKTIAEGRAKEEMRLKGEERDKAKAQEEMRRMIEGSSESGLPFSS